jgi:hypothetical protein
MSGYRVAYSTVLFSPTPSYTPPEDRHPPKEPEEELGPAQKTRYTLSSMLSYMLSYTLSSPYTLVHSQTRFHHCTLSHTPCHTPCHTLYTLSSEDIDSEDEAARLHQLVRLKESTAVLSAGEDGAGAGSGGATVGATTSSTSWTQMQAIKHGRGKGRRSPWLSGSNPFAQRSGGSYIILAKIK